MRTLEATVAQTLGEASSSDQDVWWVSIRFFALVLICVVVDHYDDFDLTKTCGRLYIPFLLLFLLMFLLIITIIWI